VISWSSSDTSDAEGRLFASPQEIDSDQEEEGKEDGKGGSDSHIGRENILRLKLP